MLWGRRGVDHRRAGNDHTVTIVISWGMYAVLLAALTVLLLRRRP
jgi:uncharacterized protein (TIGR03382 family)